ncbi:MAG: hypothetical protein Tsb0018_01840 [Opitutales bacterium]
MYCALKASYALNTAPNNTTAKKQQFTNHKQDKKLSYCGLPQKDLSKPVVDHTPRTESWRRP